MSKEKRDLIKYAKANAGKTFGFTGYNLKMYQGNKGAESWTKETPIGKIIGYQDYGNDIVFDGSAQFNEFYGRDNNTIYKNDSKYVKLVVPFYDNIVLYVIQFDDRKDIVFITPSKNEIEKLIKKLEL